MSQPEIITRRLLNRGAIGDAWAVYVRYHGRVIAFDFGPFSTESQAMEHASDWLKSAEALQLLQEESEAPHAD